MKNLALLFFIILFASSSCKLSDKVNNMLDGSKDKIDSTFNSAGKEFVAGATTQLKADSLKLEDAIGRIAQQLKDSLLFTVDTLQLKLLNAKTDSLIKVRIEKAGNSIRKEVSGLTDTLEIDVNRILDGVIDKMTSQEFIDKLQHVRDSVVDDNFSVKVDSLVQSAVRTAVDELAAGYEDKLHPLVKDTLVEVKKTIEDAGTGLSKKANNLLWAAAGLLLALLIVAWYLFVRGRRNRKTVEVLTSAIDQIPVRSQYDELIARIKTDISQSGLSNNLDQILKRQNLYQQNAWKDKNQQLLNLIVDSMKTSDQQSPAANLMSNIRSKAKEKGMEQDLESAFT